MTNEERININKAKRLVNEQHILVGKILEFCVLYGNDLFEMAKKEYFEEKNKEFEEMVQKLTEKNEGEE